MMDVARISLTCSFQYAYHVSFPGAGDGLVITGLLDVVSVRGNGELNQKHCTLSYE